MYLVLDHEKSEILVLIGQLLRLGAYSDKS